MSTERELRIQLAAAYRMIDHFGWSELIWTHTTVRVPGLKKRPAVEVPKRMGLDWPGA